MNIVLLFGGRSPEHEVSLNSARNIYAAMDRDRHQVFLVGIDLQGRWREMTEAAFLAARRVPETGGELYLVPGAGGESLRRIGDGSALGPVEVVFPITHGPNGEDGSLQGLLRQLGLPFVGPDVTGSAVAMDKDVAKRLLRDADLLVAPWLCFEAHEHRRVDFFAVANQLGTPLFVKPACMGSSVGVSKVETKAEFDAAMAEAFRYDRKVLVEAFIEGRELECAVLGNAGDIAATAVGEVAMQQAGFYDYESKYQSAVNAEILIPAPGIDEQLLAKLMLIARHAFRALDCEGMARVDMFLTADEAVYINEVNTLPGFTNISMYPKLWAQAGVPYGELIETLMELALARGEAEQALNRDRA